MQTTRPPFRPALLLAVVYVATCFAARSSDAQTTRPALARLAADVESLYREAESGTVRVRVPLPMIAQLDELAKWELSDEVRQRLRDSRLEGPVRVHVDQAPQTQPTTGPSTSPTTAGSADGQQSLRFNLMAPEFPSNEHVGLVLDEQGHVLVHCYVDRRTLNGRPIRVTAGSKTVEAALVGSDRQTRLTVLKLTEPLGKPLRTGGREPQPGELVMMLAGGRSGAGLVLWTGANREHGLVIGVDGAALGFSHGGQLLSEGAYKPIVEQLIRQGVVKRARLGAAIEPVTRDDPTRHAVPALGDRPAIRVAQVVPNSAAQAGGLRGGDIILSLAGQPVTDVFAFAATIARCRGETELKVLRGGQEQTITVILRPE